MGKDNFILYSSHRELFETLTDTQAGKLIKAIFQYEDTGEIPKLVPTTQMAFISIRTSLDINKEKYERVVERNRLNGQKGGRPKTQNNLNNPNGFLENPKKPKKADIDNEYDIDIDNDIVVDNKLSEITKYYESNIGLVLPATAPELIEISSNFDEKLVFKAIDIACMRNKRSLSYIQGILKDWERKSYKVLADIQEEKRASKLTEYEFQKNQNSLKELYEN